MKTPGQRSPVYYKRTYDSLCGSGTLANALPPSWCLWCKPVNRELIGIEFSSLNPDRAPQPLPYSFVVVFVTNGQSYYHEFLLAKGLFPGTGLVST